MLITVSKNEKIRIYPDFFKNKTVKIGNVATMHQDILTESRAVVDRAGSQWLEIVIELTAV